MQPLRRVDFLRCIFSPVEKFSSNLQVKIIFFRGLFLVLFVARENYRAVFFLKSLVIVFFRTNGGKSFKRKCVNYLWK